MIFSNHRIRNLLIILFLIFLSFEAGGYYLGARGMRTSERDQKENQETGLNTLKTKNAALKQRLQSMTTNETFIVVDTGRNVLSLKKGDKTIREAVVSCGSGSILKDPSGKRQWTFDTPRGEHRVKNKFVQPAWIRPDWAFIEEGEAIPKDPKERVEERVLGDYALGFGKGYFIHGTLYTRLLGRNVTHGCIRVGDKDLKAIYHAAGVGTRIFIF